VLVPIAKQFLATTWFFNNKTAASADEAQPPTANNDRDEGGDQNMAVNVIGMKMVVPTLKMSHNVGTAKGDSAGKKVIVDFKLDPANHADILLDAWTRMEKKKK